MTISFSYVLLVLAAGALSFLSPCVLPLVPPYCCYMAGVSIEDFKQEKAGGNNRNRKALAFAALSFVLGFTTVFVLLGLGASTLGRFVREWQAQLAFISGVIIILMGLNFLGLLRLSIFSREARFQTRNVPVSNWGAYLMGLAFAFGWTPCIGPILSPILALALSEGEALKGGILLAIYSLGLGIPFMCAAIFSGSFMKFLAKFKFHLGKIEKIIGILLVLAGLLFLTGGMQNFAYWLLETFPIFSKLG